MTGSRHGQPASELAEFLRRYDPPVRALALGLRDVVLDELVPCHEYIFQMKSRLVMLYGTSDKVMADGVCHITVYPGHVTLMFTHGAELKDPAGVLRGRGKAMRHARITSPTDLGRREIRVLLRQARRLTAGPRPRRRADTVVTRVKTSSPRPAGPQRWPQRF